MRVRPDNQALTKALRLVRKPWFQDTFIEAPTIEAAIVELMELRGKACLVNEVPSAGRKVVVTIPPPTHQPPTRRHQMPGGDIFCEGGRG